jgi:hypothetical protein
MTGAQGCGEDRFDELSGQVERLRREMAAEMDRRSDRVDGRLDRLDERQVRTNGAVRARFFSLNQTIIWVEGVIGAALLIAFALVVLQL